MFTKHQLFSLIHTFIIFTTLLLFSCSSINEKTNLIGNISFEQWKNSKYWNEHEYFSYPIDSLKIINLNKLIQEKKFKIIIFASVFCDDCLEKIPHIIKIIEMLNIPTDNIIFYGLDEYSTEPSGYYKQFKFNSTPAIFFKGMNERLILINSSNDLIDEFENALRKL